MEQILKSLLCAENLPERTKYAIIQRIKDAGQAQTPEVVKSVLSLTSEWYLNEKSGFAQKVGLDIYKHWAKAHSDLLVDYMSRERLVSLLTGSHRNSENVPLFINANLEVMDSSPAKDILLNVIKAMSINYVKEHINLISLINFVKVLHGHRECIPEGQFAGKFCAALTRSLSVLELPTDHQEMVQAILDVKAISNLIFHIWSANGTVVILETLKEIFSIISTTEELVEPSFYLGAIISHVPIEVTDSVVKVAVDSTENDECMVAAISRMIGWLRWPGSRKLDRWIILFFKTLASRKKYSVLITATEKNIMQVFEKIIIPSVREAAINILSHMLLSCQHSPDSFHSVLSQCSQVIEKLKAEKSTGSMSCLNQLVQLINCLMFHFAGYPEVYDPVIELIKEYPSPSKESIQSLLSANKWTAQRTDYKTGFSQLVKKFETGKTGLCNLGNTCYMNSILQTLYMCDEFRKNVLNHKPHPGEICLVKLQHVFAFLMLSQRPAYAPSKFLKASKPEWFTDGHQQDCSEYLKYFLDQLKEQGHRSIDPGKSVSGDTPNNHVTTNVFEGQMKTVYRCLNCQTESSNFEAFNDLAISFPESEAAYSNSLAKRGVKTRSKEQKDEKMTETVNNSPLHLNDLVNGYFIAEELSDENQYHCDKCEGLQNAIRTIEIQHAPEYLILTLLRFSYSTSLSARTKILCEVVYPKLILLPVKEAECDNTNNLLSSVINILNCDEKSSSKQYDVYCLCSVIIHSGNSSEHGHYYCYARNSLPLKLNLVQDMISDSSDTSKLDFFQDKWFLFNDSHVTNASYSSFSNITKRFAKDTAYVLCYRRINTASLEQSDIDFNTSVDIAHLHQPVRQDLLAAVSRDNTQYLQEQELAARSEQKKAKASFASCTSYDWQDPDDDRQPPGSCGGGGGGLGGMDMSGARFIF